MDPDQDLLDKLEKSESGGTKAVVALMAGISLIAGLVGYLMLQLALHLGRQISFDSAFLIALGTGALLLVAYRKFR